MFNMGRGGEKSPVPAWPEKQNLVWGDPSLQKNIKPVPKFNEVKLARVRSVARIGFGPITSLILIGLK